MIFQQSTDLNSIFVKITYQKNDIFYIKTPFSSCQKKATFYMLDVFYALNPMFYMKNKKLKIQIFETHLS